MPVGNRGSGNKSIMKLFIRILLATVVFAGTPGTPSRAAETIRIAVQKTGTFAWELAVIRAHGLDSQANLAIEVSELEPRSRQDRAPRRQRRYYRLRLAVGVARARTWRQTDVLSVFKRARRSDGTEFIFDPDVGGSQRPQARRRRRPDRQKLAAAAGIDETGRHRPEVRVDDRLRCTTAAGGEDTQRRNGRHRQLLEFLRRAGGEGPPSSCWYRVSAAEAWRKGPHGDDRLRVRRRMGERKPRRGFPLRRHDPRGERDPGGLGCGVGT